MQVLCLKILYHDSDSQNCRQPSVKNGANTSHSKPGKIFLFLPAFDLFHHLVHGHLVSGNFAMSKISLFAIYASPLPSPHRPGNP